MGWLGRHERDARVALQVAARADFELAPAVVDVRLELESDDNGFDCARGKGQQQQRGTGRQADEGPFFTLTKQYAILLPDQANLYRCRCH